jgi:hypothetical protein
MVNWKFWKRSPPSQKTILSVQVSTLTNDDIFYVEAQSPDKALELMRELRKEAGA